MICVKLKKQMHRDFLSGWSVLCWKCSEAVKASGTHIQSFIHTVYVLCLPRICLFFYLMCTWVVQVEKLYFCLQKLIDSEIVWVRNFQLIICFQSGGLLQDPAGCNAHCCWQVVKRSDGTQIITWIFC